MTGRSNRRKIPGRCRKPSPHNFPAAEIRFRRAGSSLRRVRPFRAGIAAGGAAPRGAGAFAPGTARPSCRPCDLPEDRSAPYPSKVLTAEENVTNRLAEEFYRDHGVTRIARGLDLEPATAGHPVMRSAYCIRREIGQCLKEHPTLKGELFLMRGRFRYRLRFDCARCEMSLIDESDRNNKESRAFDWPDRSDYFGGGSCGRVPFLRAAR